jgi:hypothetical protein
VLPIKPPPVKLPLLLLNAKGTLGEQPAEATATGLGNVNVLAVKTAGAQGCSTGSAKLPAETLPPPNPPAWFPVQLVDCAVAVWTGRAARRAGAGRSRAGAASCRAGAGSLGGTSRSAAKSDGIPAAKPNTLTAASNESFFIVVPPKPRRRNAHLAATRSPKGTLITKGPSCILRGVKRPRYLHGCGISASWQNFQPLRVQTFVWQMKSTQP